MSDFTFKHTSKRIASTVFEDRWKEQPWSFVTDNAQEWSSGHAGARAAIASLAARRLREAVGTPQAPAQQGPSLTVLAVHNTSNGLGKHAQAEDALHFLRSAAKFAAGKLAERLPAEAHADVLTALLDLTGSLCRTVQALGARANADAMSAPKGASSAHACVAAVAAASQQLLAVNPAVLRQLQQLGHPRLACSWVRVLCEVVHAIQASSGARWPRELRVAFRRELRATLAHVAQALSAPPKDAFADVAGIPAQPSDSAAPAAQRWQQGCMLYLGLLPGLVETLAALGALQPHASQNQNDSHPGADAEGVQRFPEAAQSSSGSFWEDLRSAGAGGASAARPQVSRSRSTNGPGPQLLEVRSPAYEAPAPAPEQAPALPPQQHRRMLIQELGSGEQAATIRAGGVVIEELEEHSNGTGASDDEEELGVLERVSRPEQAALLLACALHSMDGRLDAPWASTDSHAAAAATLEALARGAATPEQQPNAHGGAGKAASQSSGNDVRALASAAVQGFIVDLLPSALQPLGAVLVESSEQLAAKARLEVYWGPDVFERAVAAQQLAWLVRRLGYGALSEIVGFALPCISAAAGDPSPAVQRKGLWALHHLATEALPSDLRWQREALLRIARRSLVGCDESAWPAAAPAACALAVTLEGRDVFGPGYEGVLAEMLVQGNNYAHVRPRRLIWLQAVQPLLEAMGLATVSAFSRLLPLLLEWVHAPDQDTRLAALRVLRSVLERAWPRLPAHASLIWQHIAREYESERALARASTAAAAQDSPSASGRNAAFEPHADSDGSEAHSSEAAPEGDQNVDAQRQEACLWLERVAEVLWWGGGKPFREGLAKMRDREDVESLIRAASRPR